MSSFPLTNSIIFQDGYCTTNQMNFSYFLQHFNEFLGHRCPPPTMVRSLAPPVGNLGWLMVGQWSCHSQEERGFMWIPFLAFSWPLFSYIYIDIDIDIGIYIYMCVCVYLDVFIWGVIVCRSKSSNFSGLCPMSQRQWDVTTAGVYAHNILSVMFTHKFGKCPAFV